jgi:hypothetical protein
MGFRLSKNRAIERVVKVPEDGGTLDGLYISITHSSIVCGLVWVVGGAFAPSVLAQPWNRAAWH